MFGPTCPSCEKHIQTAPLKDLEIGNKLTGPVWKGIAICCPHCQKTIGVSIDPIAIKTDIVKEILDALGAAPIRR